MDIAPILTSLRRNRTGAVLICLQVALTLAIVCNALFLIQERAARMQRPSGVDEARLFTFRHSYVGSVADVEARTRSDIEAIRSLPGVTDAMATNSFPLRGGGWSQSISPRPPADGTLARDLPATALYMVDSHVEAALGLELVEGRWFAPEEVEVLSDRAQPTASVVILTRALAQQLFPEGSAVGRTVWFENEPAVVVGVVARAQTPWAASGFGEPFLENSSLVPNLYVGAGQHVVVRTEPGRVNEVMQAVERTLRESSNARVIEDLRPFAETRAQRYRGDRALMLILGSVSVLLLGVTACGIVGLTSYWIQQRRRQIGVRRALGARRVDILRYFQVENLLIAGAGALLGGALALAGNMWLATHFAMTRLPIGFVAIGAGIVLVLAQAAVAWPALRAAAIPPALATRAV